MTTTAERIAAVHTRLNAEYPVVPDCYRWDPDPPNDYPFATWRYLYTDEQGRRCPYFTFDVHWLIPEWVIAHEMAHAVHALCGGDPINLRRDDPILAAYWVAAGFAQTYPEAYDQYINGPLLHKLAPSEHFADAFSYLTYRGFGDCLPQYYGGSWDDATLVRLDIFYKSLREETGEVTEEQVRALLEGYVLKTELESYKVALQKQLNETTAPKTHSHTATTVVS